MCCSAPRVLDDRGLGPLQGDDTRVARRRARSVRHVSLPTPRDRRRLGHHLLAPGALRPPGPDLSCRLLLSIMELCTPRQDSSFADRYPTRAPRQKKRTGLNSPPEPELAILARPTRVSYIGRPACRQGVNEVRRDRPSMGVLAITHYQRCSRAGTRCRSHHDRRPHRRYWRPRSGRAARERRLRKLAVMALDIARIKKDFPLLDHKVDGHPIVYVDSASTSQKPRVVIDAMTAYYETTNANVHRGVYRIAEEATNQMEGARRRVAEFIVATTTDRIHQERHRVAQSGGASWGRPTQSGRCRRAHRDEHHAKSCLGTCSRQRRHRVALATDS